MAKKAIIVESPAKTRTLARFVGDEYKVLASMGHIRDLPEKGLGVDVEHGFRPLYEITPSGRKVLPRLKAELKGVETVYLASDPDREGEAIGWHLVQALKLNNARRIRFNEITESAVREALANPTDIDLRLVNAQQARRVLDRLVGYMISPLLWKRMKRGANRALSAGRVQSVALRMIVDREREIGAFVPREYWSIEVTLTPTDREAPFVAELQTRNGEKLELRNEEEARAAENELKGASYRIAAIKKRTRRRNPEPPFITSTLQQQAANVLGFSSRKTMLLAQQLYEGVELPEGTTALITYMRTDSTRIAESAREEARSYIRTQFGQKYLGTGVSGQRKGAKLVQDAHEAIRPTHVSNTPEAVREHLTPDQFRLYELIWKRFVASQMAAAVHDVTTVDIEGGRYGLRAVGSVLVFPGFLTLYEEARSEDEGDKELRELPNLVEGEPLRLIDLASEQHWTKPPPRYTEGRLVRALEENGVGRPSAYAQIIDTLRRRRYVRMEQRAFVPTPLGIAVCDYLLAYFPQIMDIQFTARVEDDLDTVERGERDWVDLVRQFHTPLTQWIAEAQAGKPRPVGDKCPVCGGELYEQFSASGRFASCENYPECDYRRDIDPAVPTPEVPDVSGETCPECGSPLAVKQSAQGPFIGCEGYPQCRYIRPIGSGDGAKPRAIVTDIPCYQCAKPMVIRHGKRGAFLGCTRYPRCRATRNLTPEEAQRYGVEAVQTDQEVASLEEQVDAKCPICGADMVVKRTRRGAFLGCSRYPECRGRAQLSVASSQHMPPDPQPTGEECPECGKPLVVRSGQRGKFIGCTGYPKCRYTRNVNK